MEERDAGRYTGHDAAAPHAPARRVPSRSVLIALGNPERENAVLPGLEQEEDFVTEVYMHAHDLRARLAADDEIGRGAGAIEAVLVGDELPGFDDALLLDLARHQLSARTVVLLARPEEIPPEWSRLDLSAVLGLDAGVEDVHLALVEAARRSRPVGERAARLLVAAGLGGSAGPAGEPALPFAVIAVVSGAGSPGRSTVALNVTAGLGVPDEAILVDADLAGPSAAALVGAEPRRNIFQVAFERPSTAQEWDAAFARNVQPIDPRIPGGRVLCGLATRKMIAEVPADFFVQLLRELRARYRYVILDLGSNLTGSEAVLHRVALELAEQVVLVATPDAAGLSRAQVALGDLTGPRLGVAPERIAIVVNRHDRRKHHSRREIEYALGIPLAAVVPYDYHGLERAKQDRRPVVVYHRSAAGRALLQLAGRVCDGRILLPPDPGRGWRERLVARFARARRTVSATAAGPTGRARRVVGGQARAGRTRGGGAGGGA